MISFTLAIISMAAALKRRARHLSRSIKERQHECFVFGLLCENCGCVGRDISKAKRHFENVSPARKFARMQLNWILLYERIREASRLLKKQLNIVKKLSALEMLNRSATSESAVRVEQVAHLHRRAANLGSSVAFN